MHSILERQLKKIEANKDGLPSLEQWQSFLERVERAYTESDQERYLLERSLMLSSEEMCEMNAQLRESEKRYIFAAKGANDGLWDWNLKTKEIYYSDRWLDILGINLKEGEVFTKDTWFSRIHADDRDTFIEELEKHLNGETDHFQNTHRILQQNGEYLWVLARGAAVRDRENKAYRIAGSITDITKQKLAKDKLEYDAVHDALTGLPNRKKLMHRLTQSLQRLKINPTYSFAVLFIDIDRFKTINDSMGHQAGDSLLLEVTTKLNEIIRPNDLVARLGGDEFVVLLEDIGEEKEVEQISQRILNALQSPINILGVDIYSSASIGAVLSSNCYEKAEDLVRDADIAMYRAKTNGKGRVEFFSSQMHSGAVSLLRLEMDLRRAYERKEFLLHYQPIIALDSGKTIGFEALVRWEHPVRGMIPPSDFIPIAEDNGLILPIGNWILKEACQQLVKWKEDYSIPEDFIISVNLSAKQLEQPDLDIRIRRILDRTGLLPKHLRLEITESVIMKNAEESVVTVNKLQEMGVQISIDDFGTGYSSLSYLHQFPVDILKIDRSFINRIGSQGEHGEIIKTIIQLASNLNMDVVAEGIEDSKQLTFLQEMNCKYGQGYYYSRPINKLTATEIVKDISEETLVNSEVSLTNAKQVNELVN